MRFFHLSDLHIGRHFHYYNMKEDQVYILDQVIEAAKRERPDAVVIAGDIYDKSMPSAEAVTVFNDFLTSLSRLTPAIPVLLVGGNHDSAERLEFASEILDRQNIYIAGIPPARPEEHLKKVEFEDAYGKSVFYLLPFVKPGYVRRVFEEGQAPDTYDGAVRGLIDREEIDPDVRNVIVSHQFYTSGGEEPVRSDSETVSVGGIDQVDVSALAPFDYAALGHIHRRQKIGRGNAWYCGTLLKYSVSESRDTKVLTMVELREKGAEPLISIIPLTPLRDVREERGTLEEILKKYGHNESGSNKTDDYVSVTLTDERELYQPREQLERIFPYLLELKMDNARMRRQMQEEEELLDLSDPAKVFARFFEEMQGRPMDEREEEVFKKIMEEDTK